MSEIVTYDNGKGKTYIFEKKYLDFHKLSCEEYTEFTEDVNRIYFNRIFSFEFVSNLSLRKCIEEGHNYINREIDAYINLTLADNLKKIRRYDGGGI